MIYIYAPATSVSGGPELLQQLCHSLREQGKEAKMVYFWSWLNVKPKMKVENRYSNYGNGYTMKVVDEYENIIVVPETAIYLLGRFKRAKKVIWWLSVDFYEKSLKTWKRKINTINGLLDKTVVEINAFHLCQSYYAKDYLKEKGIEEKRIFFLSDYLSKEFIENAKGEAEKKKEDLILYNPKKGFEFTQKLMEVNPNLRWTPIINMTPKEVRELMQESKVYIDFGNHPGKDRLPREAAISGCCIVTGRRGAAGNSMDICIPDKYKLDEYSTTYNEIVERIIYILENYMACRSDFDIYRERILSEEKVFESEVRELFSENKLC